MRQERLRYNPAMRADGRQDSSLADSRLMQVLLVDHDGLNRYSVGMILARVGYVVVEAGYAEEALELCARQRFDLALIEIDLPVLNGVALLQRMKAREPDAVIILMTDNPSVETAVQALRHGACDYLIRPISSAEIRAGVDRGIRLSKALMRRRRIVDAIERHVNELARDASETVDLGQADLAETFAERDPLPNNSSALSLGGLSIVPGRYQLQADKQSVNLTPTEFDLLLYLAAHRSRVIACQELVGEIRGYASDESEAREVIRPHISNLRRKLQELGDYGKLVVNVRGIGYRLGDLPDEA